MRLRYAFCTCLVVATAALLTTPVAGCGASSEGGNGGAGVEAGSPSEDTSPYVKILREFRDAVRAKATFDAYGFAEYMPSTQRAAIDAFCFIADQVLKSPEAEGQEDPARLTQRITRKAESDLKSERDIVAPRATRRAIGTLRAVLGLETLDRNLAKSYVRACY